MLVVLEAFKCARVVVWDSSVYGLSVVYYLVKDVLVFFYYGD